MHRRAELNFRILTLSLVRTNAFSQNYSTEILSLGKAFSILSFDVFGAAPARSPTHAVLS
jgi:hypothetical protein